jgi:hypothetical protein
MNQKDCLDKNTSGVIECTKALINIDNDGDNSASIISVTISADKINVDNIENSSNIIKRQSSFVLSPCDIGTSDNEDEESRDNNVYDWNDDDDDDWNSPTHLEFSFNDSDCCLFSGLYIPQNLSQLQHQLPSAPCKQILTRHIDYHNSDELHENFADDAVIDDSDLDDTCHLAEEILESGNVHSIQTSEKLETANDRWKMYYSNVDVDVLKLDEDLDLENAGKHVSSTHHSQPLHFRYV